MASLIENYRIEPYQYKDKIRFKVLKWKFIVWEDVARFDTELEAENFIKLSKKYENKKFPVDSK